MDTYKELLIDESFFGAPAKGGKRGGADKTAVLISDSLTDEGKPKFAKMEVIENVDEETVLDFVESNIAKGSEIRVDGLSIYKPLVKKDILSNNKNITLKINLSVYIGLIS